MPVHVTLYMTSFINGVQGLITCLKNNKIRPLGSKTPALMPLLIHCSVFFVCVCVCMCVCVCVRVCTCAHACVCIPDIIINNYSVVQ